MKDPYGYRPYRGSRVRRRGRIINALLAIAIIAAAIWVLCLLLPLEEGGLRFPGQQNDGSADHQTAAAPPDGESGAAQSSGAENLEGADGSGNAAEPPDGSGNAAEPPDGSGNAAEPPDVSGNAAQESVGSAERTETPDSAGSSETDAADHAGAGTGFAGRYQKNLAKAEPLFPARPESPKKSRTVLLSASEFVAQADLLVSLYESGRLTGVAVTMKDERGILYYPSGIERVQNRREILQPVSGLPEAAARVKAAGLSLTAVMYAHYDNRYPRVKESAALQNVDRVGWRDHNLRIFLDPANAEATAYLTAVAQELEGLGFQEILLRGLGYPASGRLNRIVYAADRYGAVTSFVEAVKAAVPSTQVSVWLDTPTVAENKDTGQSVAALYGAASRVYAAPGGGGTDGLFAAVTAAAGESKKLAVVTSALPDASFSAALMILPLTALQAA